MKGISADRRAVGPWRGWLAAACLVTAPAGAIDTGRDDVQRFITDITREHGLDPAEVRAVLAEAETVQSILDAISRPAEKVKPWHEYRAIFVTPERIAAGVRFRAQHREKLERVVAASGVPEAMLLGIVGVESYFGRIRGGYRVVDALVTLGFDYPPRAGFFRSQLEEVFLLAAEEGLDVTALKGSYAGAMGPPQFIPSSYRDFAVDGDGDGRRDLLDNWEDILASIANYFTVHDWRPGAPVAAMATLAADADNPPVQDGLQPESTVGELSAAGVLFATELDPSARAGLWRLEGATADEYWVGFDNLYVITRYNRSVMYALAAWQLGEAIVREASR